MKKARFKTQARTVDHLGREQIADCPTAVSEIWKNSWDAYAREVCLTVFGDPSPMAMVYDTGHGMSRDEFENRWLTIGTSSKIESDQPLDDIDRQGLPERPRQGQKGIGRLSVARLGPVVVVITRRAGEPFVASVVDWRIFENPYLALDDVQIPVDEFEGTDELPAVLERLFEFHAENVWPTSDDGRTERVVAAWERYDAQASGGLLPSEQIAHTALRWTDIQDQHLAGWPTWNGEHPCGTAMIVMDVYPELSCFVGEDAASDDDRHEDVRDVLRRSLNGFVDPYEERAMLPEFRFWFKTWEQSKERVEISREDGVHRSGIEQMEHAVIGEVDEHGVFHGRVRAFGRDWVPWTHTPAAPVPANGKGAVGPFGFVIGSYEPALKNSTLTPDEHSTMENLADKFGGLFVYRDHLRLLPYGRPDNDFFRIEKRRTNHAGRNFWSHRRMFGRVALTRHGNPNLRDKAGREGLIDNTAMRRFRALVEDLLQGLARQFFGTDAPDRAAIISENQKRHAERAMKHARRHSKLSSRAFKKDLRTKRPELDSAAERATALDHRLQAARESRNGAELRAMDEQIDALRTVARDLQLPPRPRKLGSAEDDWRHYRDGLSELQATLDRMARQLESGLEAAGPADPAKLVQSALARHQKALHDQLATWLQAGTRLLSEEKRRLADQVAEDRKRYYELAAPIASKVDASGGNLAAVLNGLDGVRSQLEDGYLERYPPYLRALESLSQEIDLATALQWADDERNHLEERLATISALAQQGIVFEIIGHEFRDMQRDIMANLRRLPQDAQQTEAYSGALNAYRGLSRRLQFFTPLQRAGRVLREPITGEEIGSYVQDFFAKLFARERVDLIITPAFRAIEITDYRWRIYPVFINLVQNARYWVRQSDESRAIRLDHLDGVTTVSDSGPGIDPDDAEAVFELFYSRRRNGRGVGLYLARVNLAAGGHTIRVATEAGASPLPGATFEIQFKGIRHDD